MIRKIRPDDRQLFLDLEKQFYNSEAVLHPIPDSYFENNFNELMRSEDYLECYLFEVRGKNAGYALLSKSFSPEAGGMVIWIEELFILPEFRSKGIGSEFFEFLEANYKAARYRLEIEPDNVRAEKLYRRRGFETLEYVQMVKDI
jgi:GNAT superfamily N-acetyltransferase